MKLHELVEEAIKEYDLRYKKGFVDPSGTRYCTMGGIAKVLGMEVSETHPPDRGNLGAHLKAHLGFDPMQMNNYEFTGEMLNIYNLRCPKCGKWEQSGIGQLIIHMHDYCLKPTEIAEFLKEHGI